VSAALPVALPQQRTPGTRWIGGWLGGPQSPCGHFWERNSTVYFSSRGQSHRPFPQRTAWFLETSVNFHFRKNVPYYCPPSCSNKIQLSEIHLNIILSTTPAFFKATLPFTFWLNACLSLLRHACYISPQYHFHNLMFFWPWIIA